MSPAARTAQPCPSPPRRQTEPSNQGGGFPRTDDDPSPSCTNANHTSNTNDHDTPPAEAMRPTKPPPNPPVSPCHPRAEHRCRAQRRRGVVPPEHIAHEFDERRERGGSEEAILPRVVERVCWKRMEETGICLPPPSRTIVPADECRRRGGTLRSQNGHDNNTNEDRETECHFQGWH